MFWGNISKKHVAPQLIAISFATGMLDAATYPLLGCFVSNQTGNSVFIALFCANVPIANRVDTTVTSMFSFIAGAFILGQCGHLVGPIKRQWLLATNFIQSLLLLMAVVLLYEKTLDLPQPDACVIVAIVTVATGGQFAMARTLSSEITTV
jgi:uncharacterized membrane protein YoaK (UPF0700 family)